MLRRDGAAEVFRIVRIDERGVDAEPAEADVELRVGSAVEGLRGHDLVARFQQADQRDELRGLPTGHGQRADSAFEGGHALLKNSRGRIHDARIDIAEALQVEKRGGVRGVLKDVRGRLVDGHRACAGLGIGTLAGMQSAGGEAEHAVGSGSHPYRLSEGR